jgi:hypothetical protein
MAIVSIHLALIIALPVTTILTTIGAIAAVTGVLIELPMTGLTTVVVAIDELLIIMSGNK